MGAFQVAFTLLISILVVRKIAGCPKPKPLPKVLGGSPAPCGRYPYAVSIRDPDDNAHSCGGVLIHPRWVLTTDTCLLNMILTSSSETFPVAIGQFRLEEPGGEIISAQPVRRRDLFSSELLFGDNIGLLKLKKRSKFEPINLPQSRPSPGSTVVVVGWGRLGAGGAFSNVLNEASMQVFPQKLCQARYTPNEVSDLLCAGRRRATCAGDEGSPLVLRGGSPSKDTVIGIALDGSQLGVSCGDNKPGLFVDVSNHLEWINGRIRR